MGVDFGLYLVGVNLNSRPWSERTVPLVEGLMKDTAMQVLNELDLMPIHLDSVFNSSAVPGAVLEQSPDDALTLNYLGYWWADDGRHLDEAVELIKKAVAILQSSE